MPVVHPRRANHVGDHVDVLSARIAVLQKQRDKVQKKIKTAKKLLEEAVQLLWDNPDDDMCYIDEQAWLKRRWAHYQAVKALMQPKGKTSK
jgi:hypothetical protein